MIVSIGLKNSSKFHSNCLCSMRGVMEKTMREKSFIDIFERKASILDLLTRHKLGAKTGMLV